MEMVEFGIYLVFCFVSYDGKKERTHYDYKFYL